MPSPFKRFYACGFGIAALALLLSMPVGLRAEEDQTKQETPNLSDHVGDELAKVKPLIDTKNWDSAIKLIDGLLETAAAPESYDQVFLLDLKGKILAQKGDYNASIEPLAASLDIADRHHFYTKRRDLDTIYFLSQLYAQQAETYKNQRDEQIASYNKAIELIERWLKIAPKPTEDVLENYSRLLYALAVAKDPNHPDPELITRVREQLEKILLMSTHPKDGVYAFLIATLQQEQNYSRATELFELILSKNPNSKNYWEALVNLYIVLSQNEKDPAKVRVYNIRAINALERAQALGYLNTPRYNYLLFTFYYECGQYGTAADILYKDLKDGSIDSELQKWELLASSYQQINQEFTAIEVLQEASKRFPKNGDLDVKIGSVYAQLENGEKAFEYYKLASEKGDLSESEKSYLYVALAYQGYELGKYDEANDAIDKAIKLKGTPDHQQTVLKSAIEDAIKERDAKKAAAGAPEPL